MQRYLLSAWIGLLVLTFALWAQEKKPDKSEQKPAEKGPADLKLAFKPNDKYFQKLSSSTTQTLKIQNQDVKQNQEQEFVFSWTVKSVAADKVEIEQRIEAVRMVITIGSNRIEYDSRRKDQPENPVASFFKPLIGATFTLTVDPKTHRVLSVQGRDDFVKRLRDANPNMAQLLGQILSEDQMKQMAEPAFAFLPPTPVAVGGSWEREARLTLGPLGSYDAKYSYTYLGKEKKDSAELDKIEVKGSIKYKPPESAQAGGLPFKIEGGNLEAKEITGTIYFDSQKGRQASSDMTVRLSGKLTISVGDQKAEVELEQTQTTKVETSDTLPDDSKKP
ncbi:MAG: DUF6263 family protein [Gemmatales bacterium]|nr:DUF6263 family protein [Gemmatales bacterium]MCS7159735.1 DUF6263 family protein [Gemmatales bacterium]MDW8174933.1 DUF6263 family protein [Gemmatales bacterium]MDW8222439.1 DUF6263 family protein [Gemmatales bacterium]